MGLNVCPAAIVAAPVEVVWDLLRPARLSEWVDGQVEAPVPEGPALVGQNFHVVSNALGRKWHAIFTIEKVDPERHQLAMHMIFPFGIQMHEHLSCTRIDATSCRVQYG